MNFDYYTFFFILSPARTGTTYLTLLLSEHPELCNDLASPYESDYFEQFKEVTFFKKSLISKFKNVLDKNILYKSPNDCDKISRITNFFSNYYILYIVRNPLDSIESYINAPFITRGIQRQDRTTEYIGRHFDLIFEKNVNSVKDVQKNLGNNRIVFIDYEDLENNPSKVLRRLYKKTKIKVDSKQIEDSVLKHKDGNGMIKEKKYIVYKVEKKRNLSEDQINKINNELIPQYKNLKELCI